MTVMMSPCPKLEGKETSYLMVVVIMVSTLPCQTGKKTTIVGYEGAFFLHNQVFIKSLGVDV